MILADVNVLVYASRDDLSEHAEYRAWLEQMVGAPEPFAISDAVLASQLRIVTDPRLFGVPTPMDQALEFVESLRAQPRARLITPGEDHWSIFSALCRSSGARGNLVPDAWLAALAIEHGCEFVTADKDFARFEGLRWRHPLAGR